LLAVLDQNTLSDISIGLPTLTPGDQSAWSFAELWPQSMM
jgi:hypothetical protein